MQTKEIVRILQNRDVVPLIDKVKNVDVEEKEETKEVWICPYCEEEIGEKELFLDEESDKWFHRPCEDEGAIKLPDETSDLMDSESEIEIKEFGNEHSFTEEQVKAIRNTLSEFLGEDENRWFGLTNSFGVGPLQGNVAGVTRFELQPTQRHVEVVLDRELVERAPDIVVAGVLAHELKHVDQVKSGKINRLEDRAEIEKGAFQHERRFFLRHREKYEGVMLNVIDERIAQIDQLIQAYENGEMMLLAKDVQIGFKK